MGYTHYFRQQRAFTRGEWHELQSAVKQLIGNMPETVRLRGWNGKGELRLDDEAIVFNGDAETGGDFETFSLSRAINPEPNFCKTERNPYDVAVMAVLVLAHRIAPGALEIGSDGGARDWRTAAELLGHVNGCPVELPPRKAGGADNSRRRESWRRPGEGRPGHGQARGDAHVRCHRASSS